MDSLHNVLSSIRTETKSGRDHTRVIREFVSHLGETQRPQARRPKTKSSPRKRAAKRAK